MMTTTRRRINILCHRRDDVMCHRELRTSFAPNYTPYLLYLCRNKPENLTEKEGQMGTMRQTNVPSAVRREALVSRHARRVSTSSIATPSARGIIGRSIKNHVNVVLPSYATRCCSKIHRQRRTVPFASYQCLYTY